MILADSSVLIEFYRADGDPAARAAVTRAIADDRLATNGIIQVELMAFAASAADYEALESDFRAFHRLALGERQFDLAAGLGFELRRRGITVPPTDLIIAASAISARATLLHLDGRFDRIAELGELRAVHIGR